MEIIIYYKREFKVSFIMNRISNGTRIATNWFQTKFVMDDFELKACIQEAQVLVPSHHESTFGGNLLRKNLKNNYLIMVIILFNTYSFGHDM